MLSAGYAPLAPTDEDEKRKKRLARNRESARECRKRKKAKQVALKQEIAILEADNLQLRLKLQMESEALKCEDECLQITARLKNMINEGASDASIQKELAELQERYSDYGRDRRSAIDFHIAQLRRCLQPTQTTQTIVWLMSNSQQLQVGPQGSTEKAELWRNLIETLKPNADQLAQFVALSNADIIPELKAAADTSDRMLDRLVELVSNKNESLDQEMAEIQRILSARQIAKFILWIDQNPACMQMLEALWPHLATAQRRGTSDLSASSDESSEDAMSLTSGGAALDALSRGMHRSNSKSFF